MPKFCVSGPAQAWVSIIVEADSEDEAIDVAYKDFGGIVGYCGNGGSDKLVGVSGSYESIECEDFEFTQVEECCEE